MGKLINFESCDAAGKSSQMQLITEYYKLQNKKVKHLHFPMYNNNKFSDLISMYLRGELGNLNKVDPYFVANIYAMDRFMYKDNLLKDLEENDIVILDRYVISNVAYQCAKIEKKENIKKLKDWILDFEFGFLNLPYPDLIIYLNLPLNEIERRLNRERKGDNRNYLNGKKDIHEVDINFQKNVGDMYLSLKNIRNYYIIDAFEEDKILNIVDLFNQYKPIL
jgi:dTMP kinase